MIPIKDTIPRIGFPLITWIIILINGIIFIFEISIPKNILTQFFNLFGLVPARYSQGAFGPHIPLDNYLPFLTSMFLHGGWLHIIGNMWFLYLFGDNVEDQMGHVRFLIFYLLSGIAAGLAYFILDIHSTVPEIGASGAIAGVMGAYMIMFPKSRILTLIPIFIFPFFVEFPAILFIGFWFILQLFSGTLGLASQEAGGGIAWWGHVGGFITGILLLPFFRKKGHSARKFYLDEIYHFIDR